MHNVPGGHFGCETKGKLAQPEWGIYSFKSFSLFSFHKFRHGDPARCPNALPLQPERGTLGDRQAEEDRGSHCSPRHHLPPSWPPQHVGFSPAPAGHPSPVPKLPRKISSSPRDGTYAEYFMRLNSLQVKEKD